jgi:hypothetical protein
MPDPSSVEEGLLDLAAHRRPLDSLSLTYRGLSVFHGGGEDIDLSCCHVAITQQRQDKQTRGQAQLSTDTLQARVRLLREHEPWVQREPERLAIPDETRATVSIEIGGAKSEIWGWYPGRRIREVHDFLMKVAPPPLSWGPST